MPLSKEAKSAKRYMKKKNPKAYVCSYGWLSGLLHLVDNSIHNEGMYLSDPFKTEGEVWINAMKIKKGLAVRTIASLPGPKPKKKTKEPVIDEPRIFVLIPETVDVPRRLGRKRFTVLQRMEPGRQMVQYGHVISKMRVELAAEFGTIPITTIGLAVRNSRELDKLWGAIGSILGTTYSFEDKNPKFYGTEDEITTAVCTAPLTGIEKERVSDLLDHLDNWGKNLIR